MTNDELNLRLRLVALEELIRDCAPDIEHDKERIVTPLPTRQSVIWKCKPNCRRCRIDAVISSSASSDAWICICDPEGNGWDRDCPLHGDPRYRWLK